MKLKIYQGETFIKEIDVIRVQETSGGGYSGEDGDPIAQKLDLFLEDHGQPLENVAQDFCGEKLCLILKQQTGDLNFEGYRHYSAMRNLGDYENSLLVSLIK